VQTRHVRIRCPNPRCGVMLSVPQTVLGQRVRCAACGESFIASAVPAVRAFTRPRRRKAG
jgi:uncharacterized Zn finger protein